MRNPCICIKIEKYDILFVKGLLWRAVFISNERRRSLMQIHGDLTGLRNSLLAQIETLYDFTVPMGQLLTVELAESLLKFTEQMNREIAVYINRKGKILQVAIGDLATVALPGLKERTSIRKLSGVRCIHTHPNEDSHLSSADLSALKQMNFDMMAALAKKNNVISLSVAFLSGEYGKDDQPVIEMIEEVSLKEIWQLDLNYLTELIDKRLMSKDRMISLDEEERAILVGMEYKNQKNLHWDVEDSLHELEQLAETAGANVVGTLLQKRDCPDAALFLGKGKIQELAMLVQQVRATVVIFDEELSPSQQRNIEGILLIKILDRTSLILDIFAQRARSHEGKLQVELAQLRYRLPRIGGQGLVLSRLGGGIGTRGPGETKLEVDKRKIRSRITEIEKQIEAVKKQRFLQRSSRSESQIPTVALVGYTNAGKSTLLNALTEAQVLAEDKLFATLDPTTRKTILNNGQEILLTDTVGFIQKLPHSLITAFRATLEEVKAVDLLLHVVDRSHANYKEQMDSVYKVLTELDALEKPSLIVFNKSDKLASYEIENQPLRDETVVYISAKKKKGLSELLDQIEHVFRDRQREVCLLVPYSDSAVIAELHAVAVVKSQDYVEEGTSVQALIPVEQVNKFERYVVRGE